MRCLQYAEWKKVSDWGSGIGYRVSGIGYRVLGIGYWVLGIGDMN